MRLYLDDDISGPYLTQLLRKAGHDVRLPSELRMAGTHDADHLRQAVIEQRACLTRNYKDFEFLHNLVRQVQGHHNGILVVRAENDRRRNLKPHEIARAIAKLEAAGAPVADEYIILNQWR